MRRTVLVTHLDDARVLRTLDSLALQQTAADQVLVADGGSRRALLSRVRAHPLPGLEVLHAPGTVAQTRAAALANVRGDLVAFLDSDEVAPPHWLADLAAPLVAGSADATGGPTRPLAPPRSRAEHYVNRFDAWYYHRVVARDPARLPMGNSAWRTDLLRRIGGFDARFAHAGEDFDVNLRARAAGARFAYVPAAWVHHDQSHLDSLPRLWHRTRRYACGATMAYLKNGRLQERAPGAARALLHPHPYTLLLAPAKLLGYMDGRRAWRRLVATAVGDAGSGGGDGAARHGGRRGGTQTAGGRGRDGVKEDGDGGSG